MNWSWMVRNLLICLGGLLIFGNVFPAYGLQRFILPPNPPVVPIVPKRLNISKRLQATQPNPRAFEERTKYLLFEGGDKAGHIHMRDPIKQDLLSEEALYRLRMVMEPIQELPQGTKIGKTDVTGVSEGTLYLEKTSKDSRKGRALKVLAQTHVRKYYFPSTPEGQKMRMFSYEDFKSKQTYYVERLQTYHSNLDFMSDVRSISMNRGKPLELKWFKEISPGQYKKFEIAKRVQTPSRLKAHKGTPPSTREKAKAEKSKPSQKKKCSAKKNKKRGSVCVVS